MWHAWLRATLRGLPLLLPLALLPAAALTALQSTLLPATIAPDEMVNILLLLLVCTVVVDLLFSPLLLLGALRVTRPSGAVLETPRRRYVLLYLVYGAFSIAFSTGNVFVLPGLVVLLLGAVLLDPVRAMEHGRSPMSSERGWVALVTIVPMALLWMVLSQLSGVASLWGHEQGVLVLLSIELGFQLVWASVLVMLCASWRARTLPDAV